MKIVSLVDAFQQIAVFAKEGGDVHITTHNIEERDGLSVLVPVSIDVPADRIDFLIEALCAAKAGDY